MQLHIDNQIKEVIDLMGDASNVNLSAKITLSQCRDE
jgi:hypothetical protein